MPASSAVSMSIGILDGTTANDGGCDWQTNESRRRLCGTLINKAHAYVDRMRSFLSKVGGAATQSRERTSSQVFS